MRREDARKFIRAMLPDDRNRQVIRYTFILDKREKRVIATITTRNRITGEQIRNHEVDAVFPNLVSANGCFESHERTALKNGMALAYSKESPVTPEDAGMRESVWAIK